MAAAGQADSKGLDSECVSERPLSLAGPAQWLAPYLIAEGVLCPMLAPPSPP